MMSRAQTFTNSLLLQKSLFSQNPITILKTTTDGGGGNTTRELCGEGKKSMFTKKKKNEISVHFPILLYLEKIRPS